MSITCLDEHQWARVRHYVERLAPGEAQYRATEPGHAFAEQLAAIALGYRTRRRLSKALVREALKWADTPEGMPRGKRHAADADAEL